MAARRGRGRRGNHMRDEEFRDDRDEEIQALRRQVEQLTLRLERQEARSEHGLSSRGSSSDEFDVNPFGRRKRAYQDSFEIELPEFYGRLHPEEFLDWLSAIEKYFDYKETPEGQRVKIVTLRLRGYASVWWDKIQEMRLRKGKPKIHSWDKMKSRLKEKFLPVDFAQTSFSQFNNLRQESKSVQDYTEEFYKLMARNVTQEIEEQLVARYVGGLRISIRDELEVHQLWKVADAY
ncbi:hypothetical protein LWI29_019234 [Acer saccharum]|uniref:Retrotransposon gag domain-containing protein n=1 Tax=Acer saccharum TaxID=4024 RepID=A0AA39SMH3_ACESA|nr:hypothetical protein LWI29_019234 [Acer saccharum]